MNLIGEYFDDIWLYTKHILEINSRENDINKGVSNDLIDNVLASYGSEFYNGHDVQEL